MSHQALFLNGLPSGGVCSQETLTHAYSSPVLRHNPYKIAGQSEQNIDLVQAKTNESTCSQTQDHGIKLSACKSEQRKCSHIQRSWENPGSRAQWLVHAWTLEPDHLGLKPTSTVAQYVN